MKPTFTCQGSSSLLSRLASRLKIRAVKPGKGWSRLKIFWRESQVEAALDRGYIQASRAFQSRTQGVIQRSGFIRSGQQFDKVFDKVSDKESLKAQTKCPNSRAQASGLCCLK